MNRTPLLAAWLALATIGASEALHAQARAPAPRTRRSEQAERPPLVLDEASRARKMSEIEAWLGRLVGRFQVDVKSTAAFGTQKHQRSATCNAIGDGLGVRCVVGGPVMPLLFFGFDPDTLEIQVIAISEFQPAARTGMLAGNTVSFSTDNWKVCHEVYTVCWTVAEVTATPTAEIFMKLHVDEWGQGRKHPLFMKSGHTQDVELNFQRETPVDAKLPRNSR